MATFENNFYNESIIKDAEKRTERYKSGKRINDIKQFMNSRLFKDLDFLPDEEELDDGIEGF
jgi:hypothetical protein